MQFRLWSGAALFLGSYLPLALILLVQDVREKHWGAPVCGWRGNFDCTLVVFEHPWLAIGSVLLTAAALYLTLVSMKAVRLKQRVRVLEVKSIPNDLIGYLFPYVVSFMGMSYGQPKQIAGFLVFWVVLFAITYRSGQILMNPLLIVLGWRLYDVKMSIGQKEEVRSARVLKKGKLLPGPQRAEEVQDVFLMGDP
ncbi:hypothetical protein [Luteimonas sp. TWI1416]|uniref:hypothetical protein n=1 Tax=unclassified Luteimonas TaxID=2629088 RepID=UPI0032094D15